MPDAPSLPSAQGLIGATVALMTAFARRADDAPAEAMRLLMARRIVANLLVLKQHPSVDPALREVLGSAHALWAALARELDPAVDRRAPETPAGAPLPASRRLH